MSEQYSFVVNVTPSVKKITLWRKEVSLRETFDALKKEFSLTPFNLFSHICERISGYSSISEFRYSETLSNGEDGAKYHVHKEEKGSNSEEKGEIHLDWTTVSGHKVKLIFEIKHIDNDPVWILQLAELGLDESEYFYPTLEKILCNLTSYNE